ncbi:MAG: DUF2330 domain-containing protein [Actinobacteria bacterium]|nr:DUF2330 domain-containing protein [Actinomycetota bacterium]
MLRRASVLLLAASAFWTLGASAALACGGLVAPNGTVNLLKTTTLAGYRGGIEHYVTSFQFAGGGGEFGSIVPLPGIPTDVVRGGDWTLQRLVREVTPVEEEALFLAADSARVASGPAEVLLETKIDALDITILRGGGDAVGEWAEAHGFLLTPDAPEVLDFYADRSPIFMAARFDADAARDLGQNVGDGTPIHLTIPTERPWVPLRILGLGRQPVERIEADLFLLTDSDRAPVLLPAPVAGSGRELVTDGLFLERSEPANEALLADLRSDKKMKWIPKDLDGMWLTYMRLDTTAGRLTYDLAIDATGTGQPSPVDAGLAAPGGAAPRTGPAVWPVVLGAAALGALLLLGRSLRRGPRIAGL